ncbi:hypothetical protein BDN72DRAFT_846313 [Pluteus cervinus]|uniref:Uncharacterized protein n=1 Tax=Pluteus cervinus TaxID=181527 RepID=A0ACD3AGL1_9AGAR|nr:hypothetical protein BDN72DRAFT_846313 [Pluteus cervinus]
MAPDEMIHLTRDPLPVELLLKIFLAANEIPEREQIRLAMFLRIASVCHQWRQIIFSTSGFVNKFTMTHRLEKGEGPLARILERGQSWLALSDPLPCTLKVTLNGHKLCDEHPPLSLFQPLFLSISSRLHDLMLVGHDHYWEELLATLPPLPNLRTYRSLSSCGKQTQTLDLTFSPNIPWSELTMLAIRERYTVHIEDPIESLFRCPNLTTFYYRCSFSEPTSTHPIVTRSPQQFLHLKRISIDLDPGSAGDTIILLFQSLRLPALEDLYIKAETWETVDVSFVFNKLYERDPFKLRLLNLEGITIHVDSLTNLLSVLPFLESLELCSISCPYDALLRNLIFSPKDKNPMLPRLEMVTIRQREFDAGVGTVVDFVESRWWVDDGGSEREPSLRTFKLVGGKLDLKEKVLLWKSQGMDIEYKDEGWQ